MMKKLSYFLCASLLVAACGGGDDDNAGDDTGGTPDGAVSIPDAAPADAASGCAAPTNITLGPTQNSLVLLAPENQAQMLPERYVWNYVTGGGVQGTDEFLQFRANKPVTLNQPLNMASGCTTGSAFCWGMAANFQISGQQLMGDTYFAREGTVTITEAGDVGAGKFKATFSGVKFVHFVNGQPAADMCTALVADGTVDLAVQAPQKPGQQIDSFAHAPVALPELP